MQSCLRETAVTRESHPCYLIIEEVDELGSRRVVFTGGGNISTWKEKLKKEPDAERYYIMQLFFDNNKKSPKIELSNFQLEKEENYQSLSRMKTSSLPFDTISRSFLEEIISIKR